MGYVIDTTEKENINLAPGTVEEEVIQNLWFLYSSLEYDVPLDRALGLNATYIDKPIEAAKALATTDIYDKTEEYEPRAEITNIDFKADYERGILKPIVEVEINGEYEKRNIPSNLPEVEFVDTNTEALVNKLIAGYEEITGRTLYPADPVRAFILWLASVLVQERVQINESAKQNLPRYAVGKNLDSLSEIFHNTYRLQPTAASTTLGFYITTTLEQDYIITDTLEVTVDGFINFATTDYLIFKAGENYAEVKAVCTTAGTAGNDFVPGQVNKLVSDEFLYFKEVSNTTVTAGGSEEESDTAFYNRMRESEESYTTAGPRGSYIYHAKSVSSQISDVSAESPEPGIADIRIMLYGGELPDKELIDRVQEYLSADDIRPMTDKVIVAAPTTIPFDIEAVYYISRDKSASTKEIQRAVDLAEENYILWQTSKMGRDINPSYFNAMLMESGIKRVEIVKPAFTTIPKGSVAVIRDCNISFGGVEDE